MSKSKCKSCRKVAKLERRLEEAYILLFAAVRNTTVLPLGLHFGKSEKEISDKTFETIAEMKKTVDYNQTRKLMGLTEYWDKENAENEVTEDSEEE